MQDALFSQNWPKPTAYKFLRTVTTLKNSSVSGHMAGLPHTHSQYTIAECIWLVHAWTELVSTSVVANIHLWSWPRQGKASLTVVFIIILNLLQSVSVSSPKQQTLHKVHTIVNSTHRPLLLTYYTGSQSARASHTKGSCPPQTTLLESRAGSVETWSDRAVQHVTTCLWCPNDLAQRATTRVHPHLIRAPQLASSPSSCRDLRHSPLLVLYKKC